MDGQRFDRWARRFAAGSSRRGLLKGLAGSLAAGLVVVGVEETEAAQLCRRKPNGTRCRECGVCRDETCVVDPTLRCAGCQRCHADSLTCRATDDACATCEKCERDESGYRCKPLKCTDKQHCCNHRCISKDHCCTDRDCPDCGKCERGRCRPAPEKQGQRCGTRDCHVCKNGECVDQSNNAACFDGNGLCCDGVCCAAGTSCCGHACCTTGLCLGDICCDPRNLSAAGAEICCPFGPPCGEGNNARCCTEDQICCEGECTLPNDCCPEENVCGDACCGDGQTCCDGTCCDGPCNAQGDACCPTSARTCGDTCCDDGTECCGGECCGDGTFCCGETCCSTTCTGPGLSVCCPDHFFCVGTPYPDPNQHTYICCDTDFPVCCVGDGFCHPPGWVCQN